jgi:hypothetical protein
MLTARWQILCYAAAFVLMLLNKMQRRQRHVHAAHNRDAQF